jgi:hypothetical protein
LLTQVEVTVLCLVFRQRFPVSTNLVERWLRDLFSDKTWGVGCFSRLNPVVLAISDCWRLRLKFSFVVEGSAWK